MLTKGVISDTWQSPKNTSGMNGSDVNISSGFSTLFGGQNFYVLCSRCGFIHCMWWWLRMQYFQHDFSHLVDEALSLCSCTFVHLNMVDFDVKLFYYGSWWLILCFLYSCSWLLVYFWRFCAACDVVGNVYLIILKSNVQLSLPHQLSVISFAKLSALVNSFSDIDG